MRPIYRKNVIVGYQHGRGRDFVFYELRKSKKNVPYTLVGGPKGRASICFMGRRQIYRVFWPWAESEQNRLDFGDANLALSHALDIVGASIEAKEVLLDEQRRHAACDPDSSEGTRDAERSGNGGGGPPERADSGVGQTEPT